MDKLWDELMLLVSSGSGKSYTMMGSLVDETTKGIIPRLCDTLFEMIAEVSVAFSLLSQGELVIQCAD